MIVSTRGARATPDPCNEWPICGAQQGSIHPANLLGSPDLHDYWCSTLKIKALLFVALAALAAAARRNLDESARKRKGGQTEVLLVNSALVDCVGVGPMKCMQVRRSAQQPWELFYTGIEGFTFEPGYQYRLKVRVTPVENVPPMPHRCVIR